jgi:hypothetical protein
LILTPHFDKNAPRLCVFFSKKTPPSRSIPLRNGGAIF